MNELLVQVIVVAIAANVLLLLAALITSRLRGRERVPAAGVPSAYATMAVASAPTLTGPDEMEATSPASEGMGASAMGMDEQLDFRPPSPEDAGLGGPPAQDVEAEELAPPLRADLVDPETGLPTSLAWEEVLRHEEARLSRYGRPATVLVVELDRLDSLAERLGKDNADKLIAPVARALRRQARAADQVMRTGHARFNVLLPETDEIQAINYAERVRDACDAWLDAAAVSVRRAMGWASAATGTTLRDAASVAERRMHADRLRVAPRMTPARHWPTTTPGASRPEVLSPPPSAGEAS